MNGFLWPHRFALFCVFLTFSRMRSPLQVNISTILKLIFCEFQGTLSPEEPKIMFFQSASCRFEVEAAAMAKEEKLEWNEVQMLGGGLSTEILYLLFFWGVGFRMF